MRPPSAERPSSEPSPDTSDEETDNVAEEWLESKSSKETIDAYQTGLVVDKYIAGMAKAREEDEATFEKLKGAFGGAVKKMFDAAKAGSEEATKELGQRIEAWKAMRDKKWDEETDKIAEEWFGDTKEGKEVDEMMAGYFPDELPQSVLEDWWEQHKDKALEEEKREAA